MFELAEARFRVGLLRGEELLDIAWRMLEAGVAAPAVCELAALRRPTLRDAGTCSRRSILPPSCATLDGWRRRLRRLRRGRSHRLNRLEYAGSTARPTAGASRASRTADFVTARIRHLRPPHADLATDGRSTKFSVDEAVRVLLGLVERGEAISVRAWRRAAADAAR